jgi:hypothetical protein
MLVFAVTCWLSKTTAAAAAGRKARANVSYDRRKPPQKTAATALTVATADFETNPQRKNPLKRVWGAKIASEHFKNKIRYKIFF